MTNSVRMTPGSDLPSGSEITANSNIFTPPPSSSDERRTSSEPLPGAVIPGTMTSENPLKPLPATIVQSGGNPWAAFLLAARQAAPAAALLGAYATLPHKRASGLPAPRNRRSRRRKNRR